MVKKNEYAQTEQEREQTRGIRLTTSYGHVIDMVDDYCGTPTVYPTIKCSYPYTDPYTGFVHWRSTPKKPRFNCEIIEEE